MRKRKIGLIGGTLLAAALVLGSASVVLAQTQPGQGGWGPGGMMGGSGQGGMMGGYGQGGMMGGYGQDGMMGGQDPSAWMGGYGPGSMMGGYGAPGTPGASSQANPISMAQAQQNLQAYLDRLGNADLALDEVMEFENNFYAVVEEKSTGSGAFELLVNKYSGTVFLEYGPAMMWNTKYGHMVGYGGMMGMMMGGYGGYGGMMGGWQGATPSQQTAVTAQQAREIAQKWLDENQPGSSIEAPDAFPGYYTIHTLKDGKITGMLSVYGANGQVWYHSWHGAFVQEQEIAS